MDVSLPSEKVINYVPQDIDVDKTIFEVDCELLLDLIMDVAGEFGTGNVNYNFDGEVNQLFVEIDGINSGIGIANLEPDSIWGPDQKTGFFAIRAHVKVNPDSLNLLNAKHPTTKFYAEGDFTIAEETFYVSSGAFPMSLLDRLAAYFKTVSATC